MDKNRKDIYIYESFYCMSETNTLQINYLNFF